MNDIYKTTKEQKVRLYEIVDIMKRHGLDNGFITNAVEIAEIYEGAFDLFCLWLEETDENERNKIVATLQNEIEEFKEFHEESATVVEASRIKMK